MPETTDIFEVMSTMRVAAATVEAFGAQKRAAA